MFEVVTNSPNVLSVRWCREHTGSNSTRSKLRSWEADAKTTLKNAVIHQADLAFLKACLMKNCLIISAKNPFAGNVGQEV